MHMVFATHYGICCQECCTQSSALLDTHKNSRFVSVLSFFLPFCFSSFLSVFLSFFLSVFLPFFLPCLLSVFFSFCLSSFLPFLSFSSLPFHSFLPTSLLPSPLSELIFWSCSINSLLVLLPLLSGWILCHPKLVPRKLSTGKLRLYPAVLSWGLPPLSHLGQLEACDTGCQTLHSRFQHLLHWAIAMSVCHLRFVGIAPPHLSLNSLWIQSNSLPDIPVYVSLANSIISTVYVCV